MAKSEICKEWLTYLEPYLADLAFRIIIKSEVTWIRIRVEIFFAKIMLKFQIFWKFPDFVNSNIFKNYKILEIAKFWKLYNYGNSKIFEIIELHKNVLGSVKKTIGLYQGYPNTRIEFWPYAVYFNSGPRNYSCSKFNR